MIHAYYQGSDIYQSSDTTKGIPSSVFIKAIPSVSITTNPPNLTCEVGETVTFTYRVYSDLFATPKATGQIKIDDGPLLTLNSNGIATWTKTFTILRDFFYSFDYLGDKHYEKRENIFTREKVIQIVPSFEVFTTGRTKGKLKTSNIIHTYKGATPSPSSTTFSNPLCCEFPYLFPGNKSTPTISINAQSSTTITITPIRPVPIYIYASKWIAGKYSFDKAVSIISQGAGSSKINKIGSMWVLTVTKNWFSGILALPINTAKFTMSGVPNKKKPTKIVYTLAIPGGSHP
jgi:hypothetical protein